MAGEFTGIVRLVHVLSGVAMAGGVFMWSAVIMPGVQKALPPHVRGPFLQTFFPRVSKYLTWAGAVAILSGFWTMGLIVGFPNVVPVFQETAYGITLGVAAVLAIAAMGIAGGVIQPTGRKLLALAPKPPAGAPAAAGSPPGGQAVQQVQAPAPPPEVAALQKKLATWGMINFLLTILVIGLMAWAANMSA